MFMSPQIWARLGLLTIFLVLYTLWTIAFSANCDVLAGVDGDGGPFGHVFTSTNAGVTWVTNDVPQWSWQNIAVSADGTKLIVARVV